MLERPSNNHSEPVILVVDDNPVGVKLLEKILTKEGYYVVSASDGPSGRSIATQIRPELILLDIVMPGEDGLEVMKALKKDPKTSAIPVIFLTGMGDIDTKIQCFDLGAVDYITKPFQGAEVLARVRLHLKLSLATNSLIASQANKLKQIEDAQLAMLVTETDIPEARFSVHYSALLEAGGDLYDVFEISDGMHGYFVADVSGHDIATSYITAAVKALLKQNCSPIYTPMESMKMINDVLVQLLAGNKYLTATYMRLNRKAKRVSILSAGHPPAVYLPQNGEPRFIHAEGDILGIFNEVFFQQIDMEVNRGDRLLMYSDGLIERASLGNVWSKCLPEFLTECWKIKDTPISQAPMALSDLMCVKSCPPDDDVVVLCVEV